MAHLIFVHTLSVRPDVHPFVQGHFHLKVELEKSVNVQGTCHVMKNCPQRWRTIAAGLLPLNIHMQYTYIITHVFIYILSSYTHVHIYIFCFILICEIT